MQHQIDQQEQSSNEYIITFELYDGKSIATLEFERSTKIIEIFRIIKEQFDLQKHHYKSFKTQFFEHEWIVQSQATKQMIGYEDQTIEEILKEIQVDTFIFQQQGTQGIRIQNWFPQYSHTQSLPQLDESQIELVKLNKIEANVSFSENDYQQSIEYFLNVLDIDATDREAILGLDPNDKEAEFYKASSLNKQNKYQQAYEILKKFENTPFGNQSYVNEEISIAKRKNEEIQNKQKKQQAIKQLKYTQTQADNKLPLPYITQFAIDHFFNPTENFQQLDELKKIERQDENDIKGESGEKINIISTKEAEKEMQVALEDQQTNYKEIQQNEEKQSNEGFQSNQVELENIQQNVQEKELKGDQNQSDEEIEKITKKQCI